MPPVAGDSKLQTEILESLSDARSYRRWLADLARPHLGDHPIEVGSGTGDYALEWVPSVVSFTATEADDDRHKALAERFRDHPVVRTKLLWLDDGTPRLGGDDTDSSPAFDKAIGHYRRYTRRSLGQSLRTAGLEVEELRYINPAGLITWYLAVKTLGIEPRNGRLLRIYDRMLVPLARAIDKAGTSFGQSVFAVARVP
jgi:hypothetical protein